MSNLERPWRLELRTSFLKEVERINHLPLNQENAPLLVGTAMVGAGYFELAWNVDRDALFVWATGRTWEYVLEKIVRCNPNNGDYYIDSSKRSDFINKVKSKSGKSYLKAYISSCFENLLIRAKPWLNAPMGDGMFGKWVELAYLLPSYTAVCTTLWHNREHRQLG